MAQETGGSEPEGVEASDFCSIESALNVSNLNYREATALQGIVTQDVASSAEQYRKQAALEELGVDTRTDAAKLAEQYNFYFMGPDGTVFYYDVLNDLMKPDNGFLIGTDITGRIEYGGQLRENLAMCGKSPANATGNVCSEKGGVDKTTSYLNELKAAQTKADLISSLVSLEGIGELTPADVLNMGQSRLRMTEFTTSMATSGAGSTIFVLPQALVMYTAAMKKLDMIDLVIGIVGMGASFRAASVLKRGGSGERTGFFKKIGDFIKGKGGGAEALNEKFLLDDTTRFSGTVTDLKSEISAIDKAEDWPKFCKSGVGVADNQVASLKALRTEATEQVTTYTTKANGVADDALGEMASRGISHTDAYDFLGGQKTAAQIFPTDPDAANLINKLKIDYDGYAAQLSKASKNADAVEASIIKTESLRGLLIEGVDGKPTRSAALSVLEELEEGRGTANKFYINTAASTQENYYKTLTDVTKDYKAADWLPTGVTPQTATEEQAKVALGKYLNFKGFSFDIKPYKLAPADDIAKMGTETVAGREAAFSFTDTLKNTRAGKSLISIKTAVGAQKTIGGRFAAVLFPDAVVRGGKGFTVKVIGALLDRLALAIYAGPGTRAVMFAFGLHAISDLALRMGFFELTGAGLSLHYSKDEIGNYYSDESVIVLLAQNSQVKGLLSSYMGGELGAMLFGLAGEASKDIQPIVSKANLLGDVMIFGGIMYPPSTGVISVVTEQPTGTTHIEQKGNYYIMHIREWDDHVYSAVEDVRTMEQKGKGGELVTAMGLWTNKVDLYGHMYSENPDNLNGLFTAADPWVKKLGSWGVFSNLLIGSSFYSVFFTRGAFGGVALTASLLGAPLGLYMTSSSALKGAKEFMTVKYTSMKDLSDCVRTGNSTNSQFQCNERKQCAPLLATCLNQEGTGSAGMMGTTAASIALGTIPIVGAGLMLADVGLAIYKIKVREECLRDLATCQEHTFTIIGAAQYQDPVMIAQQQQSDQLKGLPGLEQLPINDFLDASGLGNVTNPLEEFSQQQLNVHTEGYNVSGRIAFDQIYYTHLQDVSIQWVEGNLPIHFCDTDEKTGLPVDGNCMSIQGDSVTVGGKTIVSNELVPFKWMDTDMPALVIPNTAVTVNIPAAPGCTLFAIDKTGTRLQLNPDVVKKFEAQGFVEVTRLMGTMRVINTDSGSIYPSVDYNGDFRLEHDNPDGSFDYSVEDAKVTADAKVLFGGKSFGFESAIFTGGTIVKRGDRIFILPKYFMPEMSGQQWLAYTQGAPLKSMTGESTAAYDSAGNLIGINAALTKIPGGEKLGTLTNLEAWKDINGDGVMQDNEQAGWRFYTDENNQSKFDLWYNGQKETYDASQIEIDPTTGDIKVYEAGQPHTEANLIRDIQTSVDSLGRTLLTIKDGKGNILLEEALVTYLKGTGGAIRYDPDNNNYIFVNGQPVELNNDFKLNGFNPITGKTDPPLLQPSSVKSQVKQYEEQEGEMPAVPLHDEGFALVLYVLAIMAGIYLVYRRQ